MKKLITTLLLSILLSSCFTAPKNGPSKNDRFKSELIQLREFFHIPGLCVLIKEGDHTVFEDYLGFSDLGKQLTMDSSTTVPMASLTKLFAGVLMMQLVQDKKISPEESINIYVSGKNIADSIKIKHVLSHTSQGEVGQHFYYSGRFGWLTAVLENVYKKTFEEILEDKIIKPLGLNNTYLLKDSTQIFSNGRKFALPYFFEGEIKDGFIDYGYSAAAGIVSTVRDLALFSAALDNNTLITPESKSTMLTPLKNGLPYAFGVFTQTLTGKRLIWGYGQYDCYSSLFLKVPEANLTLILAANNNLLSDPARLIYGDVTYSLFALSFLKNYVFDLKGISLFEDEVSLTKLEAQLNRDNSPFYIKKLLAQALAESFLARYDSVKIERSKNILEAVFNRFPDITSYGDLTLLHNLSFLKDLSVYRGEGDFTQFDHQLRAIGFQVLAMDEDNPYANYYLANYYLNKNKLDSTRVFYNKIVNAQNFSTNWYTREAENWLKEYN